MHVHQAYAALCAGGCNPLRRQPIYQAPIHVPQAELEVGQLGTLCVLLTSEAVHWARAFIGGGGAAELCNRLEQAALTPTLTLTLTPNA